MTSLGAQAERGASVHAEIAHAPTLNFAMEQAGVPVVTGARITNTGGVALDGLQLFVGIEPGIAPRAPHALARLRAGVSIDVGTVDVRLQPGRLRAVLEAERAELDWEIRHAETVLARGQGRIDVLAHNEWAGLRAPPALLASFVTPNEPVIAGVLRRVRDRLRLVTGDGAITGYQRRSEERVRAMVRALYDTLQSFGVSYVGVPASFEAVGQKVRLAETVLRESLGNCLDITVLVASCLEQMGLSPLIVIQNGHAFPGVWLIDERFHEGVVYDLARLRNAVALEQLVFFDSSTLVHDPPVPLDVAERVARDALSKDVEFLCALDIPVARRDRYRPLPLRDAVVDRGTGIGSGGASEEVRAILEEAQGAPPGSGSLADGSEPDTSLRAAASPAPAASAGAPPAVADRFRQWRDKLLDLSLRNKLLNFRTDTKTALHLDVPDISKLEDLLAADEIFDVHPRPVDARDERDASLTRARGGDETRQTGLHADLDKGILHCSFDETRMLKHAIHLDREARTALEEGGSNVLYVAVGFLRWYESDSSSNARLAPLLLVPVALEYVRTTRRLRLKHIPEESLPNWTLIEKLRADFGVELSSLVNLEQDDSGHDVPAMIRGVREAIQRMKRWEVLEEAHLGLFSFTKYLMWRDLVDNAEALLENDVVRHIAAKRSDAFVSKGDLIPPERLDHEVPPAQLPLVVDADSTQTAAVVAALRGRSFVLQGPPGTGKSQTITNLVAAALAHGKTVLFVSEKMAALDVVYRRLQSVGLGDFCLELHSHKSQKREVVQSLGRTLERSERTRTPTWDQTSGELAGMRARLNEYVGALHAPTPLGMSFHQVSGRLMTLADVPLLRLSAGDAGALQSETLQRARATAASFGTLATQVEPTTAHPFRECDVEGWSAQRDQQTRDALMTALAATGELDAAMRELCAALSVPSPIPLANLGELAELTRAVAAGPVPSAWRNDDEWRALRERVASWKEAREDQSRRRAALAARWNEQLFSVELADLEIRFAKWATAFVILAWLFLLGARRRLAPIASRGALPGNRQIAQDLAQARQANEAEPRLLEGHRALRRAFDGCGADETPEGFEAVIARGEALRAATRRAERSATSSVERAVLLADSSVTAEERAAYTTRATRALSALASYRTSADAVRGLLALQAAAWPADGERHLEEARTRFARWADQMPAYRAWCLYNRARRELFDAGYGVVGEAHTTGAIRGEQCERALERGLLSAWIMGARDATPVLRDFDGKSHHRLVDDFRTADKKHIVDARSHIASVIEGRLPTPGADIGAASEPGILRREMSKKTRHMPLRKLLQQVPNLLVRLKPCLLMSPLSVAQYLPARGRKFDLVVFDEASQICTHDAIGAIGRGAQIVVVGDSKQLPPTAFFQRSTSDDAVVDENDYTELESILDEALASGLPEQMLGWHYRSRHEALIEFSNANYYENKLNVFPAARGRVSDLGVKFHHVGDGRYEAGKSRTNPNEARALVDMLVQMLRTTSPSDRSFGIVTFSAAQQEHIENLLNEARGQYPEIDRHFADDHPNFEKVFVKNLENVQGDERDEIFFSIAYGPDETGKMLMNFGPLNRDGGERRLNVAVTRAKKQLRVFSSITADKIDTNRTRAKGSAQLKDFLRFAAERSTSSMTRSGEASGDFDSDFERDVHDVLRASGYRVETQVGCGGYRIDMAVVHPTEPGVFALGIECDGAAYHSGATARDRDRLRQEVLEGLGWSLHRIWSTDWTYDRARETDRLLEAVDRAVREGPRPAEQPKASAVATPPEAEAAAAEPTPTPTPAAAPSVPEAGSPIVAYRRAEVPMLSVDADALYQAANTAHVRDLIVRVLEIEAPIHLDELGRRVGGAFNALRLTGRLRRRVGEVLQQVTGYQVVDDFVWRRGVDRAAYGEVRVGCDRDPEALPAEEIAAAAAWTLSRSFSMPSGDLVKLTARTFGIQRLGAKVEARMRVGLDLLVLRGSAEDDGARVTWKGSE
ncbi:MAG: DUF3320 domain-containing protein [Labilithrix sp.]|nr:DUF3320 domain-containing protein [Labilithrix sp.]